MSASTGNPSADQALPSLATVDISADPHPITAAARTGTDFELRIHTSIAPFDVAAEQWFPAVAGFAVTVIVHTVDAESGLPRYLPSAEPAEWRVRSSRPPEPRMDTSSAPSTRPPAATTRAARIPPYLDTDRQAIPVPRQVLACPHYLLSTIDGREQISIPTTA